MTVKAWMYLIHFLMAFAGGLLIANLTHDPEYAAGLRFPVEVLGLFLIYWAGHAASQVKN
jgi:hypothetical protein